MGNKEKIDGFLEKEIDGETLKFSYCMEAVCHLEDRFLEDPKLVKRAKRRKELQVQELETENQHLRTMLQERGIEIEETPVAPMFLNLFPLKGASHSEWLEVIHAMLISEQPHLTLSDVKKRLTMSNLPHYLSACEEVILESQAEEHEEEGKEISVEDIRGLPEVTE